MSTSEYFNQCALHPFYWYEDFCANYESGLYTSYGLRAAFD